MYSLETEAMATGSHLNGAGPSGSSTTSFAEQLQSKHADAHRVTLEEVPDEDDIQHPPPSQLAQADVQNEEPEKPMSAKAMGKQKVQENQPSPKASPARLDTQSEELFPALGAGPKAKASAKTPMAWGSAKKPASLANGFANGNKTASIPSSAGTSRTSTPVSTPLTPTSANTHLRGPTGGSGVRLPGKYAEKWHMRPATLLPRHQLKKPVPEVLRDINRRSRATVAMTPAADGGVVFEAQGPAPDVVQQALRDVSKEVGARQTHKLEIPWSARPHIIGKQGATIKDIMQKSGADLRLPKADDLPPDADDSHTVQLSIEGDAIAVALAQREVDEIISRKAANMSVRLREIPPELFPFLAGPRSVHVEALTRGRDVDVRVPHYYTWSQQPPPSVASPAEVPAFVPDPTHHITVSGDRGAVQETRAELERRANILRKQIALTQLDISRGQHQFVAGLDGTALHDVLRETGCSVILPPASDDSETITIVGPREKLDLGMDKVMNLATSMRSANVDVGRAFPNPPMGTQAYTQALTRYLRQRRMIEELERRHDSHIVLPPLEGSNWEVYSREGKNTIKAKTDILNLVGAHPPARFRHVEVDPFYHRHLHENHHGRFLADHGVRMLLPEEPESTQVLLVFEGPAVEPDAPVLSQRPSQAETAEFEKALLAAQDQIRSLFVNQQSVDTRPVPVPAKFRDKTRKFVVRDQSALPEGTFPVEFFSKPAPRAAAHADATEPAPPASHDCYLRGPDDQLDALFQRIADFVAAEERDELERGYTTTFAFPQKFSNHLIGRRGENINKLRDEFDVEIQVRDGGNVEVKGPKAKAHACQARIQAMARKLEDEVSHAIRVDTHLHRDLIGAKGAQVNRLQDRYNVRIRFPRTAHAGLDDTASVDGSEVGTPRAGGPNRPADEILITGPKRGADDARDELLGLAKYLKDNSHTATISVAKSQLPSLIGAGGRTMDDLRQSTGAQVNVPGAEEAGDAAGRVELRIKGTVKQVADAKALLQKSVATFDDSVTKEVEVDKKYHKALIGPGGKTYLLID